MVRTRKIVPLLYRPIQPRPRQEHNIAGPIAIGSRTQPLHPLIKIDEVGSGMLCQVLWDRNQLRAIEDLEGQGVRAERSGLTGKNEIECSLKLRDGSSALIDLVESPQNRPHVCRKRGGWDQAHREPIEAQVDRSA